MEIEFDFVTRRAQHVERFIQYLQLYISGDPDVSPTRRASASSAQLSPRLWQFTVDQHAQPVAVLARTLPPQGQGLQYAREEFSHPLFLLEEYCRHAGKGRRGRSTLHFFLRKGKPLTC